MKSFLPSRALAKPLFHRCSSSAALCVTLLFLHGSSLWPLFAETTLSDLSICGGGGFADAGLSGEYFAKDDLSGVPLFTRRDVRIDFDFAGLSPAGSNAVPYASFPSAGYSIRWTGKLLPRYSETYTLTSKTTDGIRVFVKTSSSGTFQSIIDAWDHTGGVVSTSGNVSLTAGEPADIRVEFRSVNATAAVCRLRWSSPSTPDQVIESANGLATNVYTEGFTDVMKSAPDEWKREGGSDNANRDENGWPTEDAYNLIWQGVDKTQGTYTVFFNGKADLSDQFKYASFEAMAYDSATNTSTCKMIVTNTDHQNFYLHFKNTQRDDKSPVNSGVTNVRIYRPTQVGGTETYAPNSLFIPVYEKSLARFVALRWMSGTNWNQQRVWETDRTRPDYSTQQVVLKNESGFEGNGIAWEYKVALCNETGKDLYVCIPETASDDFITKLAQLIRYGSDGKEPYTSPQAKPVYPPLNSNLKVYVEYSNEVWNVGFDQFHQNLDRIQAAIKNGTDEGKAISYDQNDMTKLDINVGWNRGHVYQTVRASNLFRKVFGDDQMNGPFGRVRVLHYWQYDNAGWPPTAYMQMQFLNDYYNNADGKQHVPNPHPPSYYVWGAGGATYYNGANEQGDTDLVTGGSFERPETSDHLEAPNMPGWTFSGAAGIAKAGGPFGPPATPEQLKLAEEKNGNQPAAPGEKHDAVNEQTAYLSPGGSFSTAVTFPAGTADVYGIRFKAARKKGGNQQPFDIFLDDQKISGNDFQVNDDWRDYYSQTFKADPGSKHTIKFTATSSDKPDAVSFVDLVKVCSVDAIFASDLPASSYNCGPRDASFNGYQIRLDGTANWALAHGLRFCGYEGGWALGGDMGGTPVQNWAKFNDPRAKDAQLHAIAAFYKSGGFLNTFGTYNYCSSWDEADLQPLGQAFLEADDTLPPAPASTVSLPSVLTPANSVNAWGDKNCLSPDASLESKSLKMVGWRLWSPQTASFSATVSTSTGGTEEVLLDGVILASGPSGTDLAVPFTLAGGLHMIRVKSSEGNFAVSAIKIEAKR